MPSFDLPALAEQQGIRSDLSLTPIAPTQTLEDDLARIYLAPVREEAGRLRDDILPIYSLTEVSNQQLQSSLTQDALDMARDVAVATGLVLPFMRRTETWHLSTWRRVVKAGTGIDIAPITLAGDTQANIEAANERASALLQGNLDAFRQRIDSIVWNGVAQGKARAQVQSELADALAATTRRARNTAEDQLLSFVGELNRLRQTDAGITEYFWTHNPSAHPRWWHVARNGKVYSWSDPPEDGHPGSLNFCRCTARGIVRN